MFTGIVTDVGQVRHIEKRGDTHIVIATHYDVSAIEIGASIACSGVCLTVVDKGTRRIAGSRSPPPAKRCRRPRSATGRSATRSIWNGRMRVGDELGGHIVTGHVDGVAEIVSVTPEGESMRLTFEAPVPLARFIAPKGSVALDGVSLTVNEVDGARFGVNIIPHTVKVTTFGRAEAGQEGQSRNRSAGPLRREAGEGMSAMFHDYISSIEDVIEERATGACSSWWTPRIARTRAISSSPPRCARRRPSTSWPRYGRGLICLALTRSAPTTLEIPMMTQVNGTPNQTAFTVSIEAQGRHLDRHLRA